VNTDRKEAPDADHKTVSGVVRRNVIRSVVAKLSANHLTGLRSARILERPAGVRGWDSVAVHHYGLPIHYDSCSGLVEGAEAMVLPCCRNGSFLDPLRNHEYRSAWRF